MHPLFTLVPIEMRMQSRWQIDENVLSTSVCTYKIYHFKYVFFIITVKKYVFSY